MRTAPRTGVSGRPRALAPLAAALLLAAADAPAPPRGAGAGRPPRLDPDYSGVTIPPNIAPLNFSVAEPGAGYRVRIRSRNGEPIEWSGRNPEVRIPTGRWRRLIGANRGEDLLIDVEAKDRTGAWTRYDPVRNRIAADSIDGWVAYRLLEPQYRFWNRMGLYQRNLETFEERTILHNDVTGANCMNCHAFCGNDPGRMLFHLRLGPAAGTLMVRDGAVSKVNTATAFNRPGAYPSWHPGGDWIAFSVNKLTQFFHGRGEIRDVLDWASDLVLYRVSSNTVSTHPRIASLDRLETFPAWSADGRALYFSSAPALSGFTSPDSGVEYDRIRYDLVRIPFDPAEGILGEPETIVRSSETGTSALLPRPSPDGRFLLFCTARYGSFPVFRPDADLALVDLRTGAVSKPDVNSGRSDTFHSWSRNGRWFVFASKRLDGVCGRLFFSHVGADGRASKPFLMPQKDPRFYDTFLKTYNVPEMIAGPVRTRWQDLASAANDGRRLKNAVLDPRVRVDRTTGATPGAERMHRTAED